MVNIFSTWGVVFRDSLNMLGWNFIQFAPKLILAILLFILGWFIGVIVSRAIEQVFGAAKIDSALATIGADELLGKAGMTLNSGRFVGALVKWFIIIVFLMASLSLVGLDVVSQYLREAVVGSFLPSLIVATFILIIASFVSQVFSRTIVAAAKSAGITSANMIGVIAKYAVWIFAFILALDQLGVGAPYLQWAFGGFVLMISLGGALAFGLGGRDAAARLIEKVSHDMSNR